jgi:hypothetical protein
MIGDAGCSLRFALIRARCRRHPLSTNRTNHNGTM